MRTQHHREQGQVIIILVAGIISLLGFSALAIDGARLFSEKRTAQGVSDTAAFTAAAYLGQYTQSYLDSNWMTGAQVEAHAEQAALERIRSNGYTDAAYDPFGGNDRLRITIDRVAVGTATQYLIKVTMISEVQPIFAQLIYHDEMLVNVESHAILMLGNNIAYGNAMYSLSDSDCKALKFNGNSEVEIVGAGIHSNSNCTPNAIDFSGTADAIIEGTISTPGGIDDGGSSYYSSGGDIEGAPRLPVPKIPTPDCSGLPSGVVADDKSGTVVFSPGRYTSKIQITSKKNNQIFLPGFYCLQGGMLITNGNLSGSGVTFYIPNDDFKVTGGSMNFSAPKNGEADFGGNSWDGMLFYMGQGNWDTTAQADTYLEGTIYAPGKSGNPTCQFTGGGSTIGQNVQFICDTIALTGGSGLLIQFDNSNAYAGPVTVDLIQ